MENINPKTGKRLGKFLWKEEEDERENYIKSLREKIQKGYYTSDNVVSTLIDELAPAMCNSIGVESF